MKKPMNDKILIEKIGCWIRNEAAKELPDGYVCIIGGKAEKAAREAVVVDEICLEILKRTSL